VIPRRAQRLSALVDPTELGPDLTARLQAAEDAIYHDPDDALVNWDLPELEAALLTAGFQLQGKLRYDTRRKSDRSPRRSSPAGSACPQRPPDRHMLAVCSRTWQRQNFRASKRASDVSSWIRPCRGVPRWYT
jgi:hypothetical protein